MVYGLHQVGTSTAGGGVKKIPVHFLMFSLHYITVQFVYATSNGPCVFKEINSGNKFRPLH
jgi:hypothetical protein